jgi:hypothetical protein
MPNNDLKPQKHQMEFCSVLGWHLITWNVCVQKRAGISKKHNARSLLPAKGRNFKKTLCLLLQVIDFFEILAFIFLALGITGKKIKICPMFCTQ